MAAPLTSDDLRDRARGRLPRFIFDFIDGGAGDEIALHANRDAFRALRLLPRVLSLPEPPRLETHLLGETLPVPFGIAPMGLANLVHPGTDMALARASAVGGVPLGVSMMASSSVGDFTALAGQRIWLQLYTGMGAAVFDHLIDRAAAAGVTTLLFTVDANYPGLRLRDRRNGFPSGLRRGSTITQLLRHPAWTLATARAGAPRPVNVERALSGSDRPLAQVLAMMARAPLHWGAFDQLRQRWPGKLIVKGILAPDDAVEARERGA
ncbi:MAG: alpha-hydroxy-acid oxidizing protein, partial [Sphingomonadales bacterium]